MPQVHGRGSWLLRGAPLVFDLNLAGRGLLLVPLEPSPVRVVLGNVHAEHRVLSIVLHVPLVIDPRVMRAIQTRVRPSAFAVEGISELILVRELFPDQAVDCGASLADRVQFFQELVPALLPEWVVLLDTPLLKEGGHSLVDRLFDG